MKNLLKQFVAADESTLEGVDPSDLGSIDIKNYFDSNAVVLKLFKSSKGKAGNNKPYVFKRRLSMSQVNIILEKLYDMRKVEDDFFADGIDEHMEMTV